MTNLPNGLRMFAVERDVNGINRTFAIAARNVSEASRKADESAAEARKVAA